jgi:rRNA-processing protein FCF1
MTHEEDPTTQELRLEQLNREATERGRAETSIDDEEAEQHERRAEKATYLREKLEERAEAERASGRPDDEG